MSSQSSALLKLMANNITLNQPHRCHIILLYFATAKIHTQPPPGSGVSAVGQVYLNQHYVTKEWGQLCRRQLVLWWLRLLHIWQNTVYLVIHPELPCLIKPKKIAVSSHVHWPPVQTFNPFTTRSWQKMNVTLDRIKCVLSSKLKTVQQILIYRV